jgi:hypothetical protein
MAAPADRFRDDGSVLQQWADPEVLVVCPRCAERAVVRRVADGPGRRLTCLRCGLARDSAGTTSTWGVPADPWFGAPLWLQAEFRGHTVWAFNAGHLEVLRDFVGSTHRERTPSRGAAMSMVDKLPGWMTAAEHRDAVVSLLDRLASRTRQS